MLSLSPHSARYTAEYASGVEVVATLRAPVESHADEQQATGGIPPREAVVRMVQALRAAADECEQEARGAGIKL